MTADLRPIFVEQIRQLRSELLRPFEPPGALVYVGDDAADTLHVGAFADGELVGITTVCRDPIPGSDAADEWRLRGVAVRPAARGRGIGRALLTACMTHAAALAGRLIWCNGRTTATAFYTALGFTTVGPEFAVPGTGPHFQFQRVLSNRDA